MTQTVRRASSRQKLLDAASDIVAARGVQELTIEGVAAAAGVTKGGLIYHFKTKDDLLGALVERIAEQLDQRFRERASMQGNTRAALMAVLIEETFGMADDEKRLLSNLLAAASSYPHLLAPVQALFERIYQEFSDSGPALLLAAALDGISLLELLNLQRFSPSQRAAMQQAALALASQIG
jgi:AcrR family transcriptional regulator